VGEELDLDRRPAPLYSLRLPKWNSHHVAGFNQDLANTTDEPQQVSLSSDQHSLCKGRRRRGRSESVAVGCKEQDFAEMSEVR
jgi:hypothetical protein